MLDAGRKRQELLHDSAQCFYGAARFSTVGELALRLDYAARCFSNPGPTIRAIRSLARFFRGLLIGVFARGLRPAIRKIKHRTPFWGRRLFARFTWPASTVAPWIWSQLALSNDTLVAPSKNSPSCFGNLLTMTYAPSGTFNPTELAGNKRSPILNLCSDITRDHTRDERHKCATPWPN